MTGPLLSIGQLAELSGVSAHTLRYYERLGLLQAAGRAGNGHRRYHAADQAWLGFVLRLKAIGMPLAQIRHYAQLREAGDAALAERLALLDCHRARLQAHIAELNANLAVLDDKVLFYQQRIAETAKDAQDGTQATSR
ncbi:MerR family transcriptional regulator [Chitinimonas sp.]|uniref:MerR family transcriptional regulator n=1 Tax=Chitinimonas sp. TaxID=1934313 RepID=UPI0035B49380